MKLKQLQITSFFEQKKDYDLENDENERLYWEYIEAKSNCIVVPTNYDVLRRLGRYELINFQTLVETAEQMGINFAQEEMPHLNSMCMRSKIRKLNERVHYDV